MPKPPAKDSAKKTFQIVRPPISSSSLVYVPEYAVPGYQDRIETGIPWTLLEQAVKHHKKRCLRNNIRPLFFSDALNDKLQQSIAKDFLNEKSSLTLEKQWELLPAPIWDVSRFGNEEAQVCFESHNYITDDLIKIIKKAVSRGDRNLIRNELKRVSTLRIVNAKMTHLDSTLSDYRDLSTLILCGNYLSDIDIEFLPSGLRMLELQLNKISNISNFAGNLPSNITYLGLSRNLLTSDCYNGLSYLCNISVLDLADNDIYELEPILEGLSMLHKLFSLQLAGNPCSVCAAYAVTTISSLPQISWLDEREVLETDRSAEPYIPHADDLRSAYFTFSIFRIISAPQPPKPDKGATGAFYVELELPLLDSSRRQFLMVRNYESLIEILPPPEDEIWPVSAVSTQSAPNKSSTIEKTFSGSESSESDVYNKLTAKNSREIINYTIFRSNPVQWNKIMTFQEPALHIFCPDLRALRDTFRTEITLRFIYTLSVASKPVKPDKKNLAENNKNDNNNDLECVLARIKCKLERPDWTQNQQHFHWDDSLETEDAIHYKDGDLSTLQYIQQVKPTKGKADADAGLVRLPVPDNLTCHFGFGIEKIHLNA